jgi:hypothetical protein
MRFVLKEELFTNPAFVTQNIERFVSKHDKKPDEPELPDPVVAVVATAVSLAFLSLGVLLIFVIAICCSLRVLADREAPKHTVH